MRRQRYFENSRLSFAHGFGFGQSVNEKIAKLQKPKSYNVDYDKFKDQTTLFCSLQQLKDLYLIEQMTLEEIGEKFGISKQAVHYRLKRAGTTFRLRSRKA